MPTQKIRPGYISIEGSSNGQVLASNGTAVYWANQTGGTGGGGGGGVTANSQSFTGNGTNTVFTLAQSTLQDNAIVTINGIVQAPNTNYTISGTTLTFTGAPNSNASIEVRTFSNTSGSGGGGATGGGSDQIFYENDITVTADYTIANNKNAMTAGPITINSNVVVTIPANSVWTIV